MMSHPRLSDRGGVSRLLNHATAWLRVLLYHLTRLLGQGAVILPERQAGCRQLSDVGITGSSSDNEMVLCGHGV